MEQTNLHKQKLYSLIAAGVALIALVLPWLSAGFFGSANGFRGWGFLSMLGVAGVAIASFMNDKAMDYDANMKKIVLASFGAIALGALLFLLRKNSILGGGFVKTGFGLWLCLAAGAAGLLFHLGIIKVSQK